jgi:putative ABC transport system permease protein
VWRNYLIVGLRALLRNRSYAFITIVGLAAGMAACMLLLLYVQHERSYDAWLPNAGNIYQVQSHWRDPETGESTDTQMSAYVAGKSLAKDFPQIERVAYAFSAAPVVIHRGQALPTEDVVLVDGPFFDMFRFPFTDGDPATALREPGSVVLSESEARKYFGGGDVIGQTLTLVMQGKRVDHRVTGVMRDLPRNSHMRLAMVARFDPGSYFAESPEFLTAWGWYQGWNYLALRPGTDPAAIAAQLPAWEKRNIPDDTSDGGRTNFGDEGDWSLVDIRDVHLGDVTEGAMSPGNDRRTIVTFVAIAFLILAMAVVNFINLTTARAGQRAREVALRKVLGATRRQLMLQFLVESVLIAALAMLVALAIVELSLPWLSAQLGAELQTRYTGAGGMLPAMLLLTLAVGLLGGLYPAFYLSRFQPAEVLKANKSSAEAAGAGRLRAALVVGQFAVSIGLIICTVVVYAQTLHALSADPGYRREGILQIAELDRRQLVDRSEAIAREIARVPGIRAVGRTGIGIGADNQLANQVHVPGRAQPAAIGSYMIDDGFFRTMEMKLLAGRPLDRARPLDGDPRGYPSDLAQDRALAGRGLNVVVNALAARQLGFNQPGEAVGAQLRMDIAEEAAGLVPVTIVGVVDNARLRSIRDTIEPTIFRLGESELTHLVARYEGAEPREVRDRVEQTWRRLVPDVPFNAAFGEEIVAELYDAEEARAQTFAGFATIAVIIACLGLFALAAFTAERRTKEIGIRKVLGANSRDIVRLLAVQMLKPVVLANLIAWPVAWWVMRDWLNTFDSRIALGPGPFIVAGLAALAIAFGTVAGHALKVARANPIRALRYE